MSLILTIVRHIIGSSRELTSGIVVAALALIGAVSILFTRPHSEHLVIAVSAATLALGIVATLCGVFTRSVAIILIETIVASVQFGSGFSGALKTTLSKVLAVDRAGLMSALLTVSYVAVSAPVMVADVAISLVGLVPTAVTYEAGTVLLSLAAFSVAQRSNSFAR